MRQMATPPHLRTEVTAHRTSSIYRILYRRIALFAYGVSVFYLLETRRSVVF